MRLRQARSNPEAPLPAAVLRRPEVIHPMRSDAIPRLAVIFRSRLAIALAFLWALAVPRAAYAEIQLDARIGFGQSQAATSRYRPGTWTPITIYLSGQGPHGTGQLTVKLRRNGHTTAYTRKIALHDGPLNEAYNFVMDLRPANEGMMMAGAASPEVSAQLVVEGREQARRRIALPLAVNDETFNILALTRDGSGMNFLATKRLALIHRGVSPARLQNQSGGAVSMSYGSLQQVTTSQLLYTDPKALPGMAQGYSMIDAVALADQPLDNMTEDQTAALQAYVREGGLLIISGGGDMSRLKSQFYQEMLPITPRSAAVVASSPELSALEARYELPLGLKQGVALTVGALRPGARTLFGPQRGTTGYGLVAARPYGNGTVLFTAFDFLAPEFRGWRQTPSLWRDILRCGDQSLSPLSVLTNNAHFGYESGNRALADAMAGQQASNSPPLAVIAAFLGCYLVLLIPASYLLLKKLDRRELAWFSAPGLVLVFSVIAYLIALSIKGAALTANRVVVLESQANTDQVAGYGQTTIYSPRRATYDIAFGAAGATERGSHAFTPAEVLELTPGALGDMTIENDQDAVIRGAEVRLWDKRSFDCPVVTSLGGPVEIVTTVAGPDRVRATVTNGTKYKLQDCSLVNDKGQVVSVGTLEPGEKREVREPLTWAYRDSAASVSLPPAPPEWRHVTSVSDHAAETPDQVRNNLRFALTSALTTQNTNYEYQRFYGQDQADSYGRNTNAFTAWVAPADRPLMEVRIDGKPGAGQEAALLFVHLPPAGDFPPAVARAANPFQQDPVLTLKDEAPEVGGRIIP